MTNEELVKLYQEGNKKALNELIKQNQGIIHKLAHRHYININKSRVLEYDDLIQSGTMGLIIASQKYDFDNPKKAQFITYAVHYINAYINKCVYGKGKANTEFYNNCMSLNVPIGENENTELEDILECEDYSFENVEERLFIEELHKDLESLMNEELTLRERESLKLHYGWDNTNMMTYKDIAELFGVSGEMIRQNIVKAMRKLRGTKWAHKNYKMFMNYGYISNDQLGTYRCLGWT